MNNINIFVISKNRPLNVKKIRKFLYKNDETWLVGKGEEKLYKLSGASKVIESGKLMESRNFAIAKAKESNSWQVQISDDLTSIKWADKENALDIYEAIEYIISESIKLGSKYSGVAPTANKFFYNEEKKISTAHFIVGDFIFIAPDSEIKFDEELKLKEDYDFTLANLQKYGVVARFNNILANFQHRTNHGGAVDYRTDKREQEAIAYLKQKWGDKIRDNPKRPNEILMKWK